MSSFPIHWAATAARMKAAPPNIRPKIPVQNTTTLKRNRFNIIPDIKTRRDRLLHLQNGPHSRLPHFGFSSLSTTRLHPSFLFLSSMSAIDPVCSISAITSSSTLNKHQLTQLSSTPGTGDIQREGIKANNVLPPFTVLMLQYQALSASNMIVRMRDRLRESKHNDDHLVSGNDIGDGEEECAGENNKEEDNRKIEG